MMRVEGFGYWSPQDAERRTRQLEPGDVVAFDFKPWRLIDIRRGVEKRDKPGVTYTVYRLRPVDADDANRDEHWGWTDEWNGPVRLREHYSLCIHCGELPPCRAVMAERRAGEMLKRVARYENAGVCPACGEVVTTRQEAETFPNIVAILGPPVTFHMGRRKCRREAEDYRTKVGQPESQLRLDGGEG